MLVDLDLIEVTAFASAETIMTIELEFSDTDWVARGLTKVHLLESINLSRVQLVVGPLVTNEVEVKARALNVNILLDHPDQLLSWVIEVNPDLVATSTDRFITSELELLDQILVMFLGKSATLISIQINIVNIQSSCSKMSLELTVSSIMWITSVDEQFVEFTELNVNSNLMVLESNQRKSQTNVTVEPELERDIQSVTGTSLTFEVGTAESSSVSNHTIVCWAETNWKSQG